MTKLSQKHNPAIRLKIRTRLLLAVALTLAATPLAAAQTPAPSQAATTAVLPQTPAGQHVKLWLDALNSPDPKAILSVDPRAAGIRAQTGGLDLISVDSATDTQIAATVKDRLFGNYTRHTWIFDTASPPKLVGLRAQPAPLPAGVAPLAPLDDKALAAFIDEAMAKTDYSGALLVARDGKPVFSAARGLADREKNIANTLDTQFRVGSMNKMMTATAIMQLVQAGKVKLDAPVGAYLKDYPNKEFASAVTVHHLLTHTGGAGDIFGPQFTAKRLELKTLKDYVALYGSRAPEFTPGDDNRYANYGFVLLGRIIEEVSGQTYPDYLRDHVFKPAGMTRTGFEPEDVAVEGRSKGYMPDPQGGYKLNTDTLPYAGTSAGGGYSTVRDFLAFSTALTSHKLLDAKHTALLTTRKVSNGYAYGFGDQSTPELRMYGHSGGAPGMNGDLVIIGEGEAVIVALSNVSPPGFASTLMSEIRKRISITRDGKLLSTAPATGTPIAPEETRMAAFKASDDDNDGKLDKAAYRKLLQTLGFADQLNPLFAQRDANKDGFVSTDEFRNPIPQ